MLNLLSGHPLAHRVRDLSGPDKGFKGEAVLYRLDPPVPRSLPEGYESPMGPKNVDIGVLISGLMLGILPRGEVALPPAYDCVVVATLPDTKPLVLPVPPGTVSENTIADTFWGAATQEPNLRVGAEHGASHDTVLAELGGYRITQCGAES